MEPLRKVIASSRPRSDVAISGARSPGRFTFARSDMLVRTAPIAFVLVLVTACRIEHAETPEERQERNQQVWAEGQRAGHEKAQRERAASQAKQAAFLAQQQAASDARKQAKEDAFAADCRSDLADREVELQKRLASRAHKRELDQWEIDHCKFVDNSQPVIRTGQDSRGEFHTWEGRDRAVERICDAKPPTEIEHTYSQFIGVYRMPPQSEGRTMNCESVDVQTSDVARDYWSRSPRER